MYINSILFNKLYVIKINNIFHTIQINNSMWSDFMSNINILKCSIQIAGY